MCVIMPEQFRVGQKVFICRVEYNKRYSLSLEYESPWFDKLEVVRIMGDYIIFKNKNDLIGREMNSNCLKAYD